jgi:hypothetical protein
MKPNTKKALRKGYEAYLPDGTILSAGDIATYDGIEADHASTGMVISADEGACSMILVRHEFLIMRVVYEHNGKQEVRRVGKFWDNKNHSEKIHQHPDAHRCFREEFAQQSRRKLAITQTTAIFDESAQGITISKEE